MWIRTFLLPLLALVAIIGVGCQTTQDAKTGDPRYAHVNGTYSGYTGDWTATWSNLVVYSGNKVSGDVSVKSPEGRQGSGYLEGEIRGEKIEVTTTTGNGSVVTVYTGTVQKHGDGSVVIYGMADKGYSFQLEKSRSS